MVWWMFDGHFFTTNHANVNSQEHRDTREDTLVEVGSYYCFSIFLFSFFLHLFHQFMDKLLFIRSVSQSRF